MHPIIGCMLLRAGVLSFLLLLASRLSGLARDAAQAATLGTSGLADVAVLLFTLPDWAAAVAASGALGYVLLPLWARQEPSAQAQSQKRVVRVLLTVGVWVGLGLVLWPLAATDFLAPGLATHLRSQLGLALPLAAVAVPMALVASVWATRLQHHRDFTGLYGANLVVNAGLIFTIIFIANYAVDVGQSAILALGVVGSGGLRLLWQAWRLRRAAAALRPSEGAGLAAWPAAGRMVSHGVGHGAGHAPIANSIWLWALLSAGGPTLLMIVARSGASGAAEGGLASFNYAWKLIELPSILVLQLLATLVLPVLAQSIAQARHADAQQAAQRARALAWAFGCACAAGLHWGSLGAAQLLFGWGKMDQGDVQQVAQWAASGAWVLVPQAALGISGAVLAARGQLKWLGLAYGAAAVLLLAAGQLLTLSPVQWMQALVVVTAGVALVALWAERAANAFAASHFLPVSIAFGAPFAMSVALSLIASWQNPWQLQLPLAALAVAVGAACLVVLTALAANPPLRAVFAGLGWGRK